MLYQASYLKDFAALYAKTPLSTWKAYLRWATLRDYSRFLDKRYVDERFAFYGTILSGVPQNRPRWQRGVALVNESIGEALGRVYVAKYFPPESKARMEKLVANLLATYKQSIDQLDWMGPETKKEAQAKLAKIAPKIGYPSKWRDYSKLEIAPDDLVGNVMRARRFEFDRNVAKLGKPIDRDEWFMTPQTVNAYYNPTMNEIVFPAAILQPPYFNPEATTPPTTAAPARRSATRSATASTTPAASSTATATCATGGRRKTTSASTRRRRRWSRSSTPTAPCPDISSTAS